MAGERWHVQELQHVVAEIQNFYINELSQEGRIHISESIVPQFQWFDLVKEICSIGTEMTDVVRPWYTYLEKEYKIPKMVKDLSEIKF